MNREVIVSVELMDTRELLLAIAGIGQPFYQYVYREAAGVYWDPGRRGFKSTPLVKWSCSKWFGHIVEIAKQGLGVELVLAAEVTWQGIPEQDRLEIQASAI
jgi:hypothetical protein